MLEDIMSAGNCRPASWSDCVTEKGGEPVKEKRATIQIRIEPELKERLERIAEQKALNISALLRKWIEEFVEREEQEEKNS